MGGHGSDEMEAVQPAEKLFADFVNLTYYFQDYICLLGMEDIVRG